MKNLNSLLLEGNVVRDPVVQTTPTGKTVATFPVATSRYKKSDSGYTNEVSFFDVETWGKSAEVCATNCKKGRGIRIVGRIKQNRWVGNDGKNYSKFLVIAEHIEYKPIFSKKEDDDSAISSQMDAVTEMEEEMAEVPAF